MSAQLRESVERLGGRSPKKEWPFFKNYFLRFFGRVNVNCFQFLLIYRARIVANVIYDADQSGTPRRGARRRPVGQRRPRPLAGCSRGSAAASSWRAAIFGAVVPQEAFSHRKPFETGCIHFNKVERANLYRTYFDIHRVRSI